MQIKTDLQNDFAWTLFDRYRKHCDKEQSDMGIQHFAKYLVSCGVIRERTVQQLMVLKLYPQALACSGGKMQAIAVVAEETGIPERTVRFMVDNPERYGKR